MTYSGDKLRGDGCHSHVLAILRLMTTLPAS